MAESGPDAGIGAEVRAGDRVAWLSALFAPEAVRPALYALAAYRIELRRVVAGARDPLAAEIRLEWWREAIRDAGTGAGRSLPLVDALRDGAARYGWPHDTLCAVSEAHIHDLYADPFADFDAFDGYAGEAYGAPVQLAAMALGVAALGREDGFAAARTAATAAGWAGIALAAADAALAASADLSRGRSRLPTSAFPPGVLAAALPDGRLPDEAAAAVAATAAHGMRAEDELRRLLPAVHAAVRAAFLPALVARGRLAAAARRPLDPRPPADWREQFALWSGARRMRQV